MENIRITDKYNVYPIKKEETYDWLLKKHYARRIPNIEYAFGLYDERILFGIITFGKGGSINNNYLGDFTLIELNRLVIHNNSKKNILSFFVSQSLKKLPKPMAVISYADIGMEHHGYIYQATNWFYTGFSSADIEFIKNGRQYHRKGLYSKYGTSSVSFLEKMGYKAIKQHGKHRYYYFVGSKKERKLMKKEIEDKLMPYPKGNNKEYDAGHEPLTQDLLI